MFAFLLFALKAWSLFKISYMTDLTLDSTENSGFIAVQDTIGDPKKVGKKEVLNNFIIFIELVLILSDHSPA